MKSNAFAHQIGGNEINLSPSGTEGWEGVVRQLVSTLRFGVVQIIVHESQVVQVERTEKVRFAQTAASKSNR